MVFVGKSGVGKSTIATALYRRGHPCFGDDFCAISKSADGNYYVAPGYPHVKLWPDVLEQFQIDPQGLRRVRPALERCILPLKEGFCEHPVPLKRLYVLNASKSTTTVARVPETGPAKIRILRDFTYRRQFLEGLGLTVQHFQVVADLAARLSVTRLLRPAAGFLLDELANSIEGDFR